MATIKKIKKAQVGTKESPNALPEVTVTSKAAKKPNLIERIIGTPEKRAERKEEREGRRAERQSNREVRRYEREERRNTRCSGGNCASKAGFGGYNKNGGVTKAKTGMKIKKKMQAGGVAGKQPKAGMVDPNGAYTKVQERTLGSMKKGGSVAKDGKWIQKAINPKHKGYCTPMTKATCTPKRKALAKTLKKMAKSRKGK